jgi:topoisomerase-4 subunit A
MLVSKIQNKAFIGKGILHVAILKKGDKRTVYNAIYRDGKNGNNYIKRFSVTSVTRDKEYHITKGTKGSEVLYFTANPNAEAEVIEVLLKPIAGVRKMQWNVNFADLAIKGRASMGNLVSKFKVKKITLKEKGLSTMGSLNIWFDDTVQRLNTDKRGELLGSFAPEDKILIINKKGEYKLSSFELTTHFEEDMLLMEKFNPKKPISAIYYDGSSKMFFVKRFMVEMSSKKVLFISDDEDSYLDIISSDTFPMVEVKYKKVKGKEHPEETINLSEFIDVKGYKAKGNKLSFAKVKEVNLLAPLEVHIDEEDLDNFEDSGMSPLEALKKTKEEPKQKTILSIDHELNEKLELPSEMKKKKKFFRNEDEENQGTLDF